MAKKVKTAKVAEALKLEGESVAIVEPVEVAPVKVPLDPATMREKPGAALTEKERIAESRKSLLSPLTPGMQFFESPEGYIVVAEAGRGHVWCRQANNGKGSLINPRR